MKLLLTAAKEDAIQPARFLEERGHRVLNLPLKKYAPVTDNARIKETFDGLDEYENIIHGSLRNVQFFWELIERSGIAEEIKNKVNFAMHQDVADYLEERGVPAILPKPGAKGIDVLEFMIRFKRLGNTLYPAGEATREEMPGLLEELGVPYNDLVIFREEPLDEEELNEFRIDAHTGDWDAVVFHSRSAVNRFFAAVPDMDLSQKEIIAINGQVGERLKEFEVAADRQVSGDWDGI